MQKNKPTMIIVVLVLIGIAFYGGDRYGTNQAISTRAATFTARTGTSGGFGAGRAGASRSAGNFVAGQIISADANTMTVKLQNGGSAIVYLSNSTTIQKSVAGTQADLVAGQYVMVSGATNSDNSVTASSIQLRSAPVATTTPAGN